MIASFLSHSTMCVGCMHSISEESLHIVGVVICAPAMCTICKGWEVCRGLGVVQ